ncbi:MAG TPA: DUF2357 domain-containing protein [Marinospirillum sp.]|uniref:DUF2357 domain-containing protein n=1 Tax=Marinospirillum sp. TaxID=2183934 RepID=UPI002B4A3179|nr:DUF2357 domain-containing protein [Marinospirillum sp.]HKM15633.1 DUF2357 domain-containing protein [Marinospirillum sp.]
MTDNENEQLNDFGQLYARYQAGEAIALQLLQGQHRYLSNLTFDPLNGEALPQRMSHWLSQSVPGPDEWLYDRFTHLINHCMDAIGHILFSPRQTVVRVHEMTPVYLAQRLDSRSVQWLSRKPGNNMREKLAANPHILAATRKMSFDTLENRLLKAFLIRTQGLILDRQDAGLKLTDEQENLIDSIQKTLRQEEFVAIKPWQHMPPNNVLLQDKQYRKVWRAWQLLQRLEEDCENQQQTFFATGFGLFSELLKQLASTEGCVLLDQAWQFKLDYLSVVSSLELTEKLAPVEVLAIDLGGDEVKANNEPVISPQAELFLSLSAEGQIKIQRRVQSGQSHCWELNFQHHNGVINVKVSSSISSHNHDKQPVPAMPADFSSLAARIIDELLPGERKSRHLLKPATKVSDNFASLMFDGASCKLKLGTDSDEYWIEPLLLDEAGLDSSQSQALLADAKVFSAKELTKVNGDSKTQQLGVFSDQLAKQFRADQQMHYLVSDHHSEFETSDLRREMSRNFNNAAPLPKSIAAAYAATANNLFKLNDLIMVLSSDCDGIYATPVYYCWGENAGEEYLERHPSIKLSQKGERQLLQDALVKSGLPSHIAVRFIELYSYREIVSNKAKMILQDGDHWYRVPAGLKVSNIDISDVLFKEAQKLQKKIEKTYFISVSVAIKQQKGVKPQQWLASDPLLGSQQLLQKQYEQPHKVFWKDHLPQLMTRLPIEGIEQEFYFVDKRTSVKPERGVAVEIPISTPFTLPSGKEELRFTVYQGTESHRQEFSLLLSLRKPLNTDCSCNLKLTYTYGDEKPYKLRFIPVNTDNKPFNYIDAQWGKKQDDTTNRVVAIPAFPERLIFEKLYEYVGNESPTDVIEWIESNLKQLNEIYDFMLYGKNEKRFSFSYQDIKWIENKDFGFYELHPDYNSVFVHKSQFKNIDIKTENYFSGDIFIKEENRFSLSNVAPMGELTEYELKSLSKKWRFPMLIFSDQARSFVDEDIPESFAVNGKKAIAQTEELLAIEGIDKNLQRELVQFLSYNHKLMPASAADNLLEMATDKNLRDESNWFKYALGDVSQPWQQQLLTQILEPVDDSGGTRAATLEIISVAMWRDKTVIHKLTAEQVTTLTQRLNEYLLEAIGQLKKQDKHYKWNSFILHLELMLALLRTRESSKSEISSLFAYGSSLTNQLLSTVEKITGEQGEALAYQLQNPKVNARVKLSVNKPDSYYRTPDLLYALKLYLSGEDGADQITITELVNT